MDILHHPYEVSVQILGYTAIIMAILICSIYVLSGPCIKIFACNICIHIPSKILIQTEETRSSDGNIRLIRDKSSKCTHLRNIPTQNHDIILCQLCSSKESPKKFTLRYIPAWNALAKPFYCCNHVTQVSYQCGDQSFLCPQCKNEHNTCYKDPASRATSKDEPERSRVCIIS